MLSTYKVQQLTIIGDARLDHNYEIHVFIQLRLVMEKESL